MPSRTNLLMLHGALGSAGSFTSLLPALEPDFNIFMLDFEGHGTASHSERDFSIQHFAENVLHLLDEHGLETIDIFGYSMGGYVALYLVSIMPERIRSITTLATKFDWTPESAAREAAALNPDIIADKVPAFAERLERMHTGAGWREVVDRTRSLLLALGDNPVLTTGNLEQIRCPVRLMVGDRDKMVSFEETVGAYKALPEGELAVLPGTTHPLEKVDPEMLTWQVRHFIQKQGAGVSF